MRYSKAISLATAAYGAYAAAQPRHLAQGVSAPQSAAPVLDLVARTYAGRDLSISAAALLSRNPGVVTTAMLPSNTSGRLFLASRGPLRRYRSLRPKAPTVVR